MNVSIPIYQSKAWGSITWTTIGLGPLTYMRSARSERKIRKVVTDHLRSAINRLDPDKLASLEMQRGLRLERPHLTMVLRDSFGRRTVTGKFPVIIEPRWRGANERVEIAYHPIRQDDWFFVDPEEPFDDQVAHYFGSKWVDLPDEGIEALRTLGKDVVKIVSFSAKPKTLLDRLPRDKRGIWDDLIPSAPGETEGATSAVLRQIGVNLTAAMVDDRATGLPREPYRKRLNRLMAGEKKQSILLVGEHGCGKSTLLKQFVQDTLHADDFASHRNLDRVRNVWSIAGKRLIAGMSYVGQWEQRCVDLVDEVLRKKVVLAVEDIGGFGRIGQTRDSDRSLADFFRGPIARGELVMIGEVTPAQLRRLEDDAPAFVEAFQRVVVEPASESQAVRMLFHEARTLELERNVVFEPTAFRTILELGSALNSRVALPGRAIDLLIRLGRRHEGKREAPTAIGADQVVATLSERSGLPEELLSPKEVLAAAEVERRLATRVLGQPAAIEAGRDLIMRIRAGLVDAKRPYAVYLFTGPTGTGKTELAKAIASTLYGATNRLIRFDMAELSGWDAPARLIGDSYKPQGLLTQQVRQQPFCVVLLDEIEKAHPSVLNLLLQLFDEGRLTDAAGDTADFTQSVVIMTSNLGSRQKAAVGFGEDAGAILLDVAKAVREFFPPELFNRVDRVVPFSPLSLETAGRIANKEMAKLLARRGLVERNVFVYAHDTAIERMARDGFNAPDGARSVRRYLEENIGSTLASELSNSRGSTMQVVRIYAADGARGRPYRLHIERVVEAEAKSGALALEPLLAAPVDVLAAELPEALSFVRRLEASDELRHLGDRVRFHLVQHNMGDDEHAEALYNFDVLRREVGEFREHLESLVHGDRDFEHALIEARLSDVVRGEGYDATRFRLFDRRSMARPSRAQRRSQLLEALGHVHFLRRAIERVQDADQHAIVVDLLRVGSGSRTNPELARSIGLLGWMARTYAGGRGHAIEVAWRRGADRGATGDVGKLDEILAKQPTQLILRMVGLCVRDFYEGDAGTHVWTSVAEGAEIVRVRIHDDDNRSAIKWVEAHDDAMRAFEGALERNEPSLPENPSAIVPTVRKFRFEVPERKNDTSLLEVEDYPLGYAEAANVRSPEEVLPRLWLLRMSRQS